MKTPLASLLLATVLCTSACATNPLDSKDGLDPRKWLDQASKEGPEIQGVKDATEQSAIDAEKEGDFNRAAQFYQQLLSRAPDNMDYKQRYGEALRRSGQHDQAIVVYDEILAKKADDTDALEGKGLTLLAKGDFTESATILAKVLKQDEKRWRSANAIGVLFALRNMHEESVAYFQEALKHSDNNPSVLNNVGLVMAMQKKYPEAIESLLMASKQLSSGSPDLKRIEMNLSLIYGLAGKADEAEKLAGKYLKGPALYNNLGMYAHMAKNDAMAKSYLNMALSNSPVYYDKAWQNLENLKGGK